MRLPKFDYLEPSSLEEACALLKDSPKAKVMGGGTDLLVNMKHRVEHPSEIVNIKGIPGLSEIREVNGEVEIGCLATLKSLYRSDQISRNYPALAMAASRVGSYHHQVMGTLGGNLCQQNRCKYFNQSRTWRQARKPCYKVGGEICHVIGKKGVCHSAYCGDVAPALLVLEAKAILQNRDSQRTIPLIELYTGDGKRPLALQPGEILTHVLLPKSRGNETGVYIKWANRGSIDFPIVGVALQMTKKQGVKAAFTAVDRKPVRAKAVEEFLRGKEFTPEVLEEVKSLGSKDARPTKSTSYPPSYKRQMMGILLKRAIQSYLQKGAV